MKTQPDPSVTQSRRVSVHLPFDRLNGIGGYRPAVPAAQIGSVEPIEGLMDTEGAMAVDRTRLTLEQFVAQAQAQVEAFAASHRMSIEDNPETARADGTVADWFSELCAYHEYLEVEEVTSNDRRRTGNVERRRISHSDR